MCLSVTWRIMPRAVWICPNLFGPAYVVLALCYILRVKTWLLPPTFPRFHTPTSLTHRQSVVALLDAMMPNDMLRYHVRSASRVTDCTAVV